MAHSYETADQVAEELHVFLMDTNEWAHLPNWEWYYPEERKAWQEADWADDQFFPEIGDGEAEWWTADGKMLIRVVYTNVDGISVEIKEHEAHKRQSWL